MSASTALRLPLAPKARGELAEARFVAKAMSLGFSVARPFGDNQPYDFIVQYNHRLTRVQVKSAWTIHKSGYQFMTALDRSCKTGTRSYTAADLDFVAAYIAPEDAWLIIPVNEFLHKKTVKLYRTSPLRRFTECWDLLV